MPLYVGCGSLHLYAFAVNSVFTVGTVLTGFSGSAPQLGKRHKVVPIGFIAVFPLDCRADVYKRQL